MNEVSQYISRFDAETQRRLEIIRATGFKVFKDAEERIYFALPTFKSNGRDIMHYAAYKKHISLIVSYDMVPILKQNYPDYGYTKATIQFLHTEPFPEELIYEICVILTHFSTGGTGNETS